MKLDEALKIADNCYAYPDPVNLEALLKLAAEVRRLQAGGWISVKERLPEPEVIDGVTAKFVPCLFYGSDTGVCAGRYYPAHKGWSSLQGQEYQMMAVTHWQPLPAPPGVT